MTKRESRRIGYPAMKGVSKTCEVSPRLASPLCFTEVPPSLPISRRHTMKLENVAIDLSGSGQICSPETHWQHEAREFPSMSRQNIGVAE
jgi:hypothetical protein